jgi:hypothetical protein
LIDVITTVYQTLRLMEYIDDAELRFPPHPNLPTEQLVSIGLEPETIALHYLSYLEIEDEISPYTHSYSYLHDVNEAREVLWEELERRYDLAPWIIGFLIAGHTKPTSEGRLSTTSARRKLRNG